MAASDRPISPHLQIWKWGLHMALSISHRTTGIGNALGALILVWGLYSVAAGPDSHGRFMDIMLSLPGRLVLFGVTLSLMLHLSTGIRHLIMDSGRALGMEANRRLGLAVLLLALLLTLGSWVAAYWYAGAF